LKALGTIKNLNVYSFPNIITKYIFFIKNNIILQSIIKTSEL